MSASVNAVEAVHFRAVELEAVILPGLLAFPVPRRFRPNDSLSKSNENSRSHRFPRRPLSPVDRRPLVPFSRRLQAKCVSLAATFSDQVGETYPFLSLSARSARRSMCWRYYGPSEPSVRSGRISSMLDPPLFSQIRRQSED